MDSGRGQDRGVSNVIGIVLIVAIVTILAAFVGLYVTGFGEELDSSPPQFTPAVTYFDSPPEESHSLEVTHNGGGTFATDNLTVRVTGATIDDPSGGSVDAELTDPDIIASQHGDTFSVENTLVLEEGDFEKAGGGTIGGSEYLNLSDATVRVVWKPGPEDRRSVIVFEWYEGKFV